jgi:catalase
MALNRGFARVPGGTPRPRLALAPFLLSHPEALRGLAATVMRKPVSSYAHCRYNAVHAFKWIDKKGAERYVRYSWIPEEGEISISRREGRRLERDQLQRDLWERLGRTPVRPIRFQLELQFASKEELESNRVCDPTAVWGAKRGEPIVTAGAGDCQERFVRAGALELNGLDEGSGDPIAFDPTHVPDGIEPSGDKILSFRPRAYAVSFKRRTGATE